MKRVLVTGAYGFIGRHSLSFLKHAGYEIHTVSRVDRPSVVGVTCHQANLMLPGVVDDLMSQLKPSHLLHFAWYTKPGCYWTSEENMAWVKMSLDLLKSFAKQGGQRVVMAGTCAEYDWRYGFCHEDVTPLSPSTLYGTCKNALQSILASYSQHATLSSAWGRIFFLYGPHEHPSRLVPYLVTSLLKKEFASCTDGKQIRDFMHVSDVAAAFVALLNSDIEGPVNIASGQPISVRDLVNKLLEKMGGDDLIRWGEKSRPTHDPALLAADIHKLEIELNWQPQFNLDTGLDDTIAWWHSQFSKVIQ